MVSYANKNKETDMDDDAKSLHPSPTMFEVFMPWACYQLHVTENVIVTRITQTHYEGSVVSADKNKKKFKNNTTNASKTEELDNDNTIMLPGVEGIQIRAIYDSNGNLVRLRIEKHRRLPRLIFKVIGLIIHYYQHLSSITIRAGLDQACVNDICQFLPYSNITDICLDDTFLEAANYHTLLEQANSLKHLSLARCSINDAVVEKIAATLQHPLPASKTLSILNLSSNKITDGGAKHLSEALRSNRKLSYLNVSNNMLTDIGAEYILNSLLTFPLTFAELLASRLRLMKYIKQKNDLILLKVKELKALDTEKRTPLRRAKLSSIRKERKSLEKEVSLKSFPEPKISRNDDSFIAKATQIADTILGAFEDPFDRSRTIAKNGVMYSLGNDRLCYLSMAYNNLSYVTLKKLLEVLVHQKEAGKKTARGLVNVSIEGNAMPAACRELQLIDELLDTGLNLNSIRYLTPKKRTQSKIAPR